MQTSTSGVPALQFHNTTFDIVDRNGMPWLRLFQVGSALGYVNPSMIVRVYSRHAGEFTDDMTALVKLPTAGGEQETRIFSPRGCYALGMFARTKVAAEFRKWVLDVLEGKATVRNQQPDMQKIVGDLFCHAVPPAPTSAMSEALALYRESVQALLLTQPMQQAHTLACRSVTRATGVDLETMWAQPAPSLLYLPPDEHGNPRIAQPLNAARRRSMAELKTKIMQVVKDARRYRAASYIGLTRQGVMPYGYALTLCKAPSETFRQAIDEMLAVGLIRQPLDIYTGGMLCFVAGGAA